MNRKRSLKKIKDPKFLKLCQAAVAEMRHSKIPGCVVGVYHQGEEFIAGFGKTSREHPLPVTPGTLFQVGSNTKPMVATAVMRLVETGSLQLDAPVKSYLPKLRLKDPATTAGLTMRHLLNHTSGFEGDYFNDFGWGDDALRRMVRSLSRLKQVTPLGEVWSYNNAAYYIVGYAIETITGKPFQAAMQELVLEPLGMRMSAFFPDDRILTGRYAIGHDLVKKRVRVAHPWAMSRAEDPAGGLLAPAHDMLTFARFHMGDGKVNGNRVLKSSTIRNMQTPRVAANDPYRMGLPWFIHDVEDMRIVLHGGGTNGQISGFWFIPGQQFALTWLTNSSETNEDYLLKAALKIYFKVSIPRPEPLDLPAETIQGYLGSYENIEMILTLTQKKSGVWLSFEHKGGFPTPESPPMPMPKPMRIGFISEDRFMVLEGNIKGSRGEFLRAPDGSLTLLRFGARIHCKNG